MIRLATFVDVPRLIEMGIRFVAETTYSQFIKPDVEALDRLFCRMIESNEQVIFVSGDDKKIDGMIGVHIYAHPMSGEKTGAEAFWWVEPESRGHGVELFDRAEAWLKVMGAKRIQMIAPNEYVARFYRKRGYRKFEEQYQRDL